MNILESCTGRYHNVPYQERLCTNCHETESVEHFLTACTLYCHERTLLPESVKQLDALPLVRTILNVDGGFSNELISFVKNIYNKHTERKSVAIG